MTSDQCKSMPLTALCGLTERDCESSSAQPWRESPFDCSERAALQSCVGYLNVWLRVAFPIAVRRLTFCSLDWPEQRFKQRFFFSQVNVSRRLKVFREKFKWSQTQTLNITRPIVTRSRVSVCFWYVLSLLCRLRRGSRWEPSHWRRSTKCRSASRGQSASRLALCLGWFRGSSLKRLLCVLQRAHDEGQPVRDGHQLKNLLHTGNTHEEDAVRSSFCIVVSSVLLWAKWE